MHARSSALGVLGRLAEPHAVAALGDDPVHDRRRPLPARDLADDRRVRQPEGRHQRVGLVGVAARLVAPRAPGPGRRGCRAPTRPRAGGSRGPPGPGRSSRNVIAPAWAMTTSSADGSGMIAQVAGRAGPDRRQRPLAAVLLGRHERDDQLALQPARARRSRRAPGRAPRIAATPPFMSHAPRPYSSPSRTSPPTTGRRSRSRGRRAARRPTWPDEHEPPPARPARPARARPGASSRGDLLARPRRVVADRRRIRVEHLDREAQRLEPVREPRLDRVLVAGDARESRTSAARLGRRSAAGVDGRRPRARAAAASGVARGSSAQDRPGQAGDAAGAVLADLAQRRSRGPRTPAASSRAA